MRLEDDTTGRAKGPIAVRRRRRKSALRILYVLMLSVAPIF